MLFSCLQSKLASVHWRMSVSGGTSREMALLFLGKESSADAGAKSLSLVNAYSAKRLTPGKFYKGECQEKTPPRGRMFSYFPARVIEQDLF